MISLNTSAILPSMPVRSAGSRAVKSPSRAAMRTHRSLWRSNDSGALSGIRLRLGWDRALPLGGTGAIGFSALARADGCLSSVFIVRGIRPVRRAQPPLDFRQWPARFAPIEWRDERVRWRFEG